MTSPYLRKPRRELDDALKERGLNRGSVGMADGAGGPGASPKGRGISESGWFVLGISALLICGALIAVFAMPDPYVTYPLEAERVNDIAPAAGPSAPTGNRYRQVIPYLPDPGMPSVPGTGTLQPQE